MHLSDNENGVKEEAPDATTVSLRTAREMTRIQRKFLKKSNRKDKKKHGEYNAFRKKFRKDLPAPSSFYSSFIAI